MRRYPLLVVVLPVAALVALVLSASAQSTADDQALPGAEVAQKAPPAVMQKAATQADKDEAKRFKDPKEVTKGMGAIEGLFTLYRFDPADKQHDPEKLLAEIPAGLLGEDLLLAMSISRGPMSGWMWGDHLVRWEIAGNQLKLATPDVRYVHAQGKPVTGAVERTYNDTYLAAVPIVAMTPKGDVLIDLGPLLKSDMADVSFLGGQVRPDLSTWAEVKVFPDNVLIDADLALAEQHGGSKIGVSYAFRRLPKLGSYESRVADPRVGYFLTAKIDWSKKYDARETFDRYIHRWKLEKQDPTLELSPPKEPIVFIIEQTVPIQWRRWVREGILEWNKAFEKVGFVNAIVVQQQTDDNEYADYDPEDARYNFFRWGVSGRAFAMGPSRVDPRTGQILDADILFDDAFLRATMFEFNMFGPQAMSEMNGPGFDRWSREQGELVPPIAAPAVENENDGAEGPDGETWAALEEELHERGRCTCSYARGMQEQLAFLYNALLAEGFGPKKIPERLIGEALRETVTHEVGHTLGLRHNFKGSAWLSLKDILQRRSQTDEPTSASIMDYNPLLFFAGDEVEKVRHFTTPTIGPYDEWAIAYGYSVPGDKPEKDMLAEIAGRCAEPALQYATDEDTMWVFSPDPLVNRFDLSSSPIDFARSRVALTDKLLSNVTDWAVQDGEPMYFLTRAFNVLWFERVRTLDDVARLVGGQYFNRANRGDADAKPPFVLVEPAKQRAALQYLNETIFNDSFFPLKPDLLNRLAPSRWSHWGVTLPLRLDYPIHDRIRSEQESTLLTLMAPPVLERIYDAELKSDAPDKFTAAELITTLRDQIWHQLDDAPHGPSTDAAPLISSIARNLQREHLAILLAAARGQPGSLMPQDLHAMVCQALRELSGKIGRTLDQGGVDFASRAHLVESKSRIDRVLDAQFQAR